LCCKLQINNLRRAYQGVIPVPGMDMDTGTVK